MRSLSGYLMSSDQQKHTHVGNTGQTQQDMFTHMFICPYVYEIAMVREEETMHFTEERCEKQEREGRDALTIF